MPRDIGFPVAEFKTSIDEPNGAGIFPVATEEELIEFVNKGRAAGGADILSALIPSVPEEADICLIANALNFSCQVQCPPDAGGLVCEDGYRYRWAMLFSSSMHHKTRQTIADAYGLKVQSNGSLFWIELPAHIGNAADAFDEGLAFQEFIKDYRER